MKKSLFLILMIMTLFMCNKVYAYDGYEIGDVVLYRGDSYFVLYPSDINSNVVTLIKTGHLDKNKVDKYSDVYKSEEGEYPYYISDKCNSDDESECYNDYEKSLVKKIVDGWSSEFDEDLITIDGYKARLINENDLINSLAYERKETNSVVSYNYTQNTPKIAKLTGDINNQYISSSSYRFDDYMFYWTMIKSSDNKKAITMYWLHEKNVYSDEYYIRPVINLNKCALNDKDIRCKGSKEKKEENDSFKNYKIGDKITYNNEEYYVIENSESTSNFITLLRDKPFTYDELNTYGKDKLGELFVNKYFVNEENKKIYKFADGTGGIAYFTRSKCSDAVNGVNDYINTSGCTNEYDASNIKSVINKWASNFSDDLVKVDGFKATIPDYSTIINLLDYDWIKNENYAYWTKIKKSENKIYSISNSGLTESSIFDKNAIRPVIYLNKCAIENNSICKNEISVKTCSKEKQIKYEKYNFGEEINYKGSKYYVLEKSGTNQNYITLLKSSPLTMNEINNYKSNLLNTIKKSDNSGKVSYCNVEDYSNDYDKSKIKKVVDNWSKIELNDDDLVSVDGYKARLINDSDIVSNLNYDVFPSPGSWTMIKDDILLKQLYGKTSEYTSECLKEQNVSPVINVKKTALNTSNYDVNSEVMYNDELYYIVSDNNNQKDYVTLVKGRPLTDAQVALYSSDDLVFKIPYYLSDTCNSGSNLSGCSNDFKKSDVKKLLDSWSSSFDNDLVLVDGYKTRILSKYDFIYNLSYELENGKSTSYVYCSSVDTPDWVNIGYNYWIMEPYDDSNYDVYQNLNNKCLDIEKSRDSYRLTFNYSSVRPVINLNKCAIGGCHETEVCVEPDKNNPIDNSNNIEEKKESGISETIVTVEKTLKNIPTLIIVICSILIVSGSTFIVYNYLKSKKERK